MPPAPFSILEGGFFLEIAVQLHSLIKPIEEMTDEELKQRLFDIRHRREVLKPVARNKIKKAEKKESNKKVSAAEKLLAGLSPEQLELLLKEINK